jgi:prepilin-type processing-associated H-X9-DG protein
MPFCLEPYIKNKGLWSCPNSNPARFRAGGETCSKSRWGWDVDYARNNNLDRRPLGMFKDAAHVITFVELNNNSYARWKVYNTAGTTSHWIWNWGRHNDGANYAFLDGHAKWVSGSRVPHSRRGRWAEVWPTEDFRMRITWCPNSMTPP